MPAYTQSSFSGGYNSFTDPWQLQGNELQVATNAVIDNGNATPLPSLGSAVATGLAGTLLSLYLLGSTWLGTSSAKRFHAEYNGKLAFLTVGSTPPQWTNGTATYRLGITAPVAACTATLNGAGSVTQNALVYYVTYVNAFGEESGPSPASAAVNAVSNKVSLSNIPTSSETGVTARRIYRLNASAIQLVTTINDNSTTTYDDTIDATALSLTTLSTQGYIPAPDLQVLWGPHAARLWGAIGNTVYFSEIGKPHAWKASNTIVLDEDVVAGISTGSGLLVLTAKRAYMIDGNTATTFTPREVSGSLGCSAPHSLVKTELGPVYWSTQGLVLVSGGLQLLTDKRLSKAEVAGITASSVMGGYWRGQYLMFHAGGGLIFDLRNGLAITKTTQIVSAVHTAKDALYVQVGTSTQQWAAGNGTFTMTVQTPDFTAGELDHFFHVRRAIVDTTAGASVTYQWMLDGATFGTADTATADGTGKAKILPPPDGWCRRVSLQLSATAPIRQVRINPDNKAAA